MEGQNKKYLSTSTEMIIVPGSFNPFKIDIEDEDSDCSITRSVPHKKTQDTNKNNFDPLEVTANITENSDVDTGCSDKELYITCNTCGEFVSRSNLLGHIEAHVILGITKCSMCDYKPNPQNINQDFVNHISMHYGFEVYPCEIPNCGRAYQLKSSLAQHVKHKHYIDKIRTAGTFRRRTTNSKNRLSPPVNAVLAVNPNGIKKTYGSASAHKKRTQDVEFVEQSEQSIPNKESVRVCEADKSNLLDEPSSRDTYTLKQAYIFVSPPQNPATSDSQQSSHSIYSSENDNGIISNISSNSEQDLFVSVTCSTCGEVLPRSNILLHVNDHIKSLGLTKCSMCDFDPTKIRAHEKNPGALLDHTSLHYGIKAHVCKEINCEKAFHWKHCLSTHESRDHAENSILQNDANNGDKNGHVEEGISIVATKQAPLTIFSAMLNQKRCNCLTCGARLQLRHLLLHVSDHLGKDQLKCGNCDNEYDCRACLLYHIGTHYGLELDKCSACKNEESSANQCKDSEHCNCLGPTVSDGSQGSGSPISSSTNVFYTKWAQPRASPEDNTEKATVTPNAYRCNFCPLVFTTKFSVRRHEHKIHDYIEKDPNRKYVEEPSCILGL